MGEESAVYPNISKLFDSEGNPIVPSAYRVEQFNLINITGKSKNITEFITSFNIIEELFSPVIICNINIRDDENLFEDLQLNGQEKINLQIELVPINASSAVKNLTMEFFVKEYPNFRKTTDATNVQEYSLVAISNFAYISQLTRISKAIPDPRGDLSGNPIDEIKYIFEKNLLFTSGVLSSVTQGVDSFLSNFASGISNFFGGNDVNVDIAENLLNSANKIAIDQLPNYVLIDDKYKPVPKFKGNITLRSPLAAIEFLRTKAYDENLAPFFVYNRIGAGVGDTTSGDTVIIESLTSILEKPVYYANGDQAPYNYTAGFVNSKGANPGDNAFYEELKKRILSLNANLKINKLRQAAAGVFGNTLQIYDYTAKDFISKRYDPYAEGLADTIAADISNGSITSNTGAGILRELAPPTDRPFLGMKFGDDEIGAPIDLGEEGEVSQYIRTELHLPPVQCSQDAANGFYTAPEIYANVLNKSKYYYSRLQDDKNIEIELYGDFNLNPGVKIELSFPKAIELSSDDEVLENDKVISGLYLITVAIHGFSQGLYKTRLKLIKLVDPDE